MPFQGGVKAAAKMLAGLSKSARDKVLETIFKKDPKMGEALIKNMYVFEDLKYLTPIMVVDLLKAVKPSDMGLALRQASVELKQNILLNSPKLLRQEMEEMINGPLTLVSKVEEAQDKIMTIVLLKIEKGEIILSRESSNKLV
jgi:flagellar motor switch protein FliG